MFGYIIMNRDELKIKDYNLYRSFYCGLCQELKKTYGVRGQISLSYDMTFVVLLLTALYEEEEVTKGTCKCIAHPFEKHPVSKSALTSYGADMNLLLTYYKCLDDWNDERKAGRKAYAATLTSSIKRLRQKYPHKTDCIIENLQHINCYEKNGEYDLDTVSGYFGNIMAELLVYKEDEWAETLREMGFFLGKFIYLMDAYEDLSQDEKNGNYNPFLPLSKEPDFQPKSEQILTMMMANCCRAFERLPIINYTDILRNILYSGVWTRYNAVTLQRTEKIKKKEEHNHG